MILLNFNCAKYAIELFGSGAFFWFYILWNLILKLPDRDWFGFIGSIGSNIFCSNELSAVSCEAFGNLFFSSNHQPSVIINFFRTPGHTTSNLFCFPNACGMHASPMHVLSVECTPNERTEYHWRLVEDG